MLTPETAFAHRVNIFCWVEGKTAHVEAYFADGDPAKYSLTEVFDSQGKKLLDGVTDEEGMLTFKLPVKDNLRIVLNAGMGHKAEYVLSDEDLQNYASGDSEPAAKEASQSTESNEESTPDEASPQATESTQIDSVQLQKTIDDSLDRKLQPVMQKLSRIENRGISISEILGGIGYIIGLMGLALYFFSRDRKEKGE